MVSDHRTHALTSVVRHCNRSNDTSVAAQRGVRLHNVLLRSVPSVFHRLRTTTLASIRSNVSGIHGVANSPISNLSTSRLVSAQRLIRGARSVVAKRNRNGPRFDGLPHGFGVTVRNKQSGSVRTRVGSVTFIPTFQSKVLKFGILIKNFFSTHHYRTTVPLGT